MAAQEQLVLDGLALNDPAGSYLLLDSLSISPPRKRQEWLSGSDADGSLLVRDPKFENRTVQFKLRVINQGTMDLALAAIGALTDKLEECEAQENGLALVWTPANSTKALTLRVSSGEVEELPISKDGEIGWFRNAPIVSLRLDCGPFLEASEVTSSTTSASTPAVTMTLASIAGEVGAKGRLIVTDLATQSRRWLEWGIQNRYYDAGTSLEIESDNMVTSGFSGTQTTRTGAYDPGAVGNNVIRGTLATSTSAICGTGNLGHVGVFRVIGRVFSAPASGNPSDIKVRLTWQDGNGPFRSNPYTSSPVANAFGRVDLGVVTISEKKLGTQKWSGRVEAYSTAAGDTIDVDVLFLMPALEGYGLARAAYTYSSGAVVGRDEFTGITAGTALNARTAPVGGVWATSGATTDFAASDNGFLSGSEEESRATTATETGPRFAILGSTNFTDVEVGVKTNYTSTPADKTGFAFARWVDASNYAFASMLFTSSPAFTWFKVGVVVAGVTTVLKSQLGPGVSINGASIRLVVFSSGVITAAILNDSGATMATLSSSHSSLATGGALQTGKPGFGDQSTGGTASTRYYDNFYVSTPAAEPIVIYSTQSAEIRWDSAIREDSSGTFWGAVPGYQPSTRLYVPPAGGPNRTSRLQVIAHRNDLTTGAWEPITDSTQLQVATTSRYIVTPR